MSWPLAIFGCFSVLVVSVFLFLLVVYIKEYSREERLLKQFAKSRRMEQDLSMPVYIMPVAAPPKKTTSAPDTEKKTKLPPPLKNKKDVN
jgi:hypothetical protein